MFNCIEPTHDWSQQSADQTGQSTLLSKFVVPLSKFCQCHNHTVMPCNDAVTRTCNMTMWPCMICSQAKLYREIIKGKDPGEASRPSLIILDDGDNLPVPPPPALEDARSPVDTPSSRRQQQQAVEVLRPLDPSQHPAASSSAPVVARPRDPDQQRADACTYESKWSTLSISMLQIFLAHWPYRPDLVFIVLSCRVVSTYQA